MRRRRSSMSASGSTARMPSAKPIWVVAGRKADAADLDAETGGDARQQRLRIMEDWRRSRPAGDRHQADDPREWGGAGSVKPVLFSGGLGGEKRPGVCWQPGLSGASVRRIGDEVEQGVGARHDQRAADHHRRRTGLARGEMRRPLRFGEAGADVVEAGAAHDILERGARRLAENGRILQHVAHLRAAGEAVRRGSWDRAPCRAREAGPPSKAICWLRKTEIADLGRLRLVADLVARNRRRPRW